MLVLLNHLGLLSQQSSGKDTEPILAAHTAHFSELAASLNSFLAQCDGFDKKPWSSQGPVMAFVSQDLLISSNRILEQSQFSREMQRKCTCAAGLGVGGAGNAEEP